MWSSSQGTVSRRLPSPPWALTNWPTWLRMRLERLSVRHWTELGIASVIPSKTRRESCVTFSCGRTSFGKGSMSKKRSLVAVPWKRSRKHSTPADLPVLRFKVIHFVEMVRDSTFYMAILVPPCLILHATSSPFRDRWGWWGMRLWKWDWMCQATLLLRSEWEVPLSKYWIRMQRRFRKLQAGRFQLPYAWEPIPRRASPMGFNGMRWPESQSHSNNFRRVDALSKF